MQHVGQRSAPARVPLDLLGEFFSKFFCPSLSLSQVNRVKYFLSKNSHASAKGFPTHGFDIWVLG